MGMFWIFLKRSTLGISMIKTIVSAMISVIVIAFIIAWTFIFAVGTVEIVHWLFTGDFFHILASNASAF